jgi:hypothetical protein
MMFNLSLCGNEIMKKVLNPTFGRGRGAPGFTRKALPRLVPVLLFEQMKERKSDISFQNLTRMYIQEFEILVEELRYVEATCLHLATNTTFENKLLILFVWVVKYVDYSVLEHLFGISKSVVGELIQSILPEVCWLFPPTHSRRDCF